MHLGQPLDGNAADNIANLLCGEPGPRYRKGWELTSFFENVGLPYRHDGSTRAKWARETIRSMPPAEQEQVVLRLGDPREYGGDQELWGASVHALNDILGPHGLRVDFEGMAVFLARREIATPVLPPRRPTVDLDEADFLSAKFGDAIDVGSLHIDHSAAPYIESRLSEASHCSPDTAPLAILFLLGSALEGILLGVALENMPRFMTSPTTPKRDGKAKPIQDWKLSELIDVASAAGFIGLDVQKFSHALRDFRNYIHPFEQMSSGYSPDAHTVAISQQVLRAAVSQLAVSTQPK